MIDWLLGSGVIVALLTGIFNIVVGFRNSKSIKEVEDIKYKNKIQEYNYLELSKALKQINELPIYSFNIKTEEELKETISNVGVEYCKVIDIYNSVSMYLSKETFSAIEEAVLKEKKMSNELVEYIYNKKETDITPSALSLYRLNTKELIIKSIQNQIREMSNLK